MLILDAVFYIVKHSCKLPNLLIDFAKSIVDAYWQNALASLDNKTKIKFILQKYSQATKSSVLW